MISSDKPVAESKKFGKHGSDKLLFQFIQCRKLISFAQLLPTAFMKGSKFSRDSSWYFPEKDMLAGSEGKERGEYLPLLYSQATADQSLTSGA